MGRIKAVLNERRLAYAEAFKILHARTLQDEHPEMVRDDPIIQAVLHDAWEDTEALRQRREAYLERGGLTEAAEPVEAVEVTGVPAVVEPPVSSEPSTVPAIVEARSDAVGTPAAPEVFDESATARPAPQPKRVDPKIAKLQALANQMLPPSSALPKLSIEGSRKHRAQISVNALRERYAARRQSQAIAAARRRQRAKMDRRVAHLVSLGAARSSAPSPRV